MLNQSVLQEVIKLKKENAFDYKIKLLLQNKGINESEYYLYLDEAQRFLESKTNDLAKKIWLIVSIASIIIVIFFVPFSFYNKAPLIICMLFGFIISYCILQLIIAYFGWAPEKEKISQSLNSIKFRIPFIAFGILFGYLLNVGFIGNHAEELEKNGIVTEGQITKIIILEKKGHLIYTVHATFHDENGKDYEAGESVSKSEAEKIFKGQKVKVKYSKDNPEVNEIILN